MGAVSGKLGAGGSGRGRAARYLPLMRSLSLILLMATMPALAEEVDLELVLLADASGSITAEEILFQRDGYAKALTDPRVLSAIAETAYGAIAVSYVEWAAATAVVVDWRRIDGPQSAAAFAETLRTAPRQAYGRNAIGTALLEAQRMIERNDFDGWRKIIDFSGDSVNSYSGPAVAAARAEVIAAGTTINGLPILCRFCSTPSRSSDLTALFETRIIGGPGAFVVTAETAQDLADAIRRKLILEISGTLPGTDIASRDTPGR